MPNRTARPASGRPERAVILYWAFQFFFSLLVWLPVFYEIQKRVGLNDAQIFGIQSAYYLAFTWLELPTGFIADLLGYRRCLRAGAAVLILSHVAVLVAPGEGGFFWHFMLLALARSFVSGASSAYLYDYLHARGRGAAFKTAEGRGRAYSLVGRILVWPLVGPLMAWQLLSPYVLTALFAAVAWVAAALLPPVAQVGVSSGRAWARFKRKLADLGDLLLHLRQAPALIGVMVQGVSVFVLARICQVNLFQPILESRQIPVAAFGTVLAATTVFEALGSAYPQIFSRLTRMPDLWAVTALSLVMAACLAGMGLLGPGGTLVALCAFCLATGLSFPIQRQLLNDVIPEPRFRATLLSLESLLDRAICAAVAAYLAKFLGGGEEGRLSVFLVGAAGASVLLLSVVHAAGLGRRPGRSAA